MNETNQTFDSTSYRTFLTYVFNQFLPATGAITQTNGEWRLARSIPGLDQYNGRGFKSQNELIDGLVGYYLNQAQSGNVTGLNTRSQMGGGQQGIQSGVQQGQADQGRKAV